MKNSLEHCEVCNQMTNHSEGVCQKHKVYKKKNGINLGCTHGREVGTPCPHCMCINELPTCCKDCGKMECICEKWEKDFDDSFIKHKGGIGSDCLFINCRVEDIKAFILKERNTTYADGYADGLFNSIETLNYKKELVEKIEKGNDKVPCDCPKGGLTGEGEIPCDKCGGNEWYKNHICSFNDGNCDCECFEAGLKTTIALINK